MSLIAWYKLDGNALDSSGNGLNLTTNTATSTTAGKIGGCYTFASGNAISTTSGINLPHNVSFTAWAYNNNAFAGNMMIFSCNSTLYSGPDLYFTGTIAWNTGDGAGNPFKKDGVNVVYPSSNAWHHYAVVNNQELNKTLLYIDGEYYGEATYKNTFQENRGFTIGNYFPGSTGYAWAGMIDDVRIYNHLLTEKEIKELAKAKVLHYTFDEFQEPTTNILKNTLYENRTYNYTYGTSNWGGDSASVIYYQTGGYNNLPYKKLIKTAPGDGGSYIDDNFYFTIEDNKTYTASIYMKASRNVSLNGYAFSLNRSSDNVYRTTSGFSVTTEWKRFEWVYNSLTGHAGSDYQVRSIIYDDTDLPLEVFWCAPQLEAKDHATPFVNGTRTGSVSDNSGYDNHADLALATTPQWTEDSRIGSGCYSFKGDVDRSIYLPYNHMLNIREEITLSCWVKRTTATYASDAFILSRQPSWYFYDSYGSGEIRAEVFIGGIRRGGQTASVPFDGNWYLVTYTYSSITKESKIYRNGQLISSTTLGGLSSYLIDSSTSSVYIGTGGLNKGLMYDDPRIYATALSADDIKELYQTRAQIDNKGNLYANQIEEDEEMGQIPEIGTDGVFNQQIFSEIGPTNGLVAYYPLNGDAKDYANANDGTVNGAIISAGINGKACYSFDGVNGNYIRVSTPAMNPINHTITGWFLKRSHTKTSYPIFLSYGLPYIACDGSTSPFRVSYTATGQVSIAGGIVPQLDTWYHVCATFASDGVKMYVNGNLQASSTTPSTNTSSSFELGRHSGSNTYQIDGKIQNVRIYNRALSPEEISILYDLEKGDAIKAKMDKNTLYVGGQIYEG